MFDEALVKPMREELSRFGIEELCTPEQVDAALAPKQGTVLCFVNSVCGCAAAYARPAVLKALRHSRKPDRVTSVFALQDAEATARARQYFKGYPPSSPSVALLKNGAVVYFLQRFQIEGKSSDDTAALLMRAFDEHCDFEPADR